MAYSTTTYFVVFIFVGVLIAGFVMSLLTYLSARNHAKSTLLTTTDAADANTVANDALANLILFIILVVLGAPASLAFLASATLNSR